MHCYDDYDLTLNKINLQNITNKRKEIQAEYSYLKLGVKLYE